jgi:uncharacterized RDD family membrane protein YckC
LNCPSCGRGLPGGPNDSCPFCGALLALPTEGALAPELRPVTPPARDKVEPMREIPGLSRKRERTWKDDVRERVRDRREKRGGESELPLFREEEAAPAEPEPPAMAASEIGPDDDGPQRMTLGDAEDAGPDAMIDLPLNAPPEPGAAPAATARRQAPAPEPRVAERNADDRPGPTRLDLDDDTPAEWSPSLRPVERPALGLERLQAAALDLVFLGSLWAVVLYFAGRAAGADVPALAVAWPYVAAYLGSLGLLYAAFFTGATGQTPGKMVAGLRVVDRDGLPPGFVRALLRAAVGSVGALALGAGMVPLFFDPARRTLHDRLFHTRVVKG